MELIVLFLLFLFIIGLFSFIVLKKFRSYSGKPGFFFEYIIFFLYFLSLTMFVPALLIPGAASYQVAIDPVDCAYTPFAHSHAVTLAVYFFAGSLSSFQVWTKGKKLPPLCLVLCLVMMLIEALICIPVIMQLSYHYDEVIYYDYFRSICLMTAPAMTILIVFLLFLKVIFEEAEYSEKRHFSNRMLDFINLKLASSKNLAIWAVILLVPVFLIMTIMLLLFGQDHDSVVKVFTETTTWKFSQYGHPPYLEHQGHYLCTVAACGHPAIVRPLRTGTRKGAAIIVNRQLLVANAFEELLSDHFPQTHRWVRENYDRYGYPLSRRITSSFRADLVYVMMKPLEYLFLVCLYLFCGEPEKKINRQYPQ